jgi:hypothetical protein
MMAYVYCACLRLMDEAEVQRVVETGTESSHNR